MKNGTLRTMISLFSVGFLLSGMPVMGVDATEQNITTQEMSVEDLLETAKELMDSAEEMTDSAEHISLTPIEDQVNVAEGLNNYDSFVSARNYAAKLSQLDNEPVVVAVVDSGIDKLHTMFRDRVIPGYDYVDNDSNPADTHGHGTNVASVVVDCTQGLDSKIRIMPVRVLNDNNQGAASWIANGIRYAADHGAKVICLALGGEHNDVKESAIHYAIEKGALVVVSAGSSGYDLDVNKYCPAHMGSEAGVIAASALGKDGKLASFSNFGKSVDLVAMGENVKVAKLGGGYTTGFGTNIPTAVVSAIAAELFYEHPDYTPQQIETLLLNNAVDLGTVGRDTQYGMGRVSADAFYNKYTVTYSADGATNIPESITVVEGEIVEIPSTIPEKWSASFRDWRYTYRSGGRLVMATYQPGDKIKVTKNMTLTAEWNEPTVIDNTFPQNYNAVITKAGSHLWYEFTPTETGKYVFNTSQSSSVDTLAALYREDKALLQTNDDGGDGRAFEIAAVLHAGQKYYLETYLYSKVSGGSYIVTADRVPYVIKKPESQTVEEGEKVSFRVEANGIGLSYQWYCGRKGGELVPLSPPSAKTNTLEFTASLEANGNKYLCMIVDANGKTLETNLVTLTVTPGGPEIIAQPVARTVNDGDEAQFIVVASGKGLTYQWKVSSNNGTSWTTPTAAAAKNESYRFTSKLAQNGYLFKCAITDSNGKTVETNAVKLTVRSNGPVITTQPTAQTVNEGAKATFKVVATGEGLTYQWKTSSNNGSTWSTPSAAAAKTATYGVTSKFAYNGYLFKCVITDGSGKTVETNAVKLTVKANGPVITTQPAAQTVNEGTKATFRVVASGDGLTYQWKVSSNNGTSWSSPSAAAAKTATYSITTKASQNGYLFKCVITDANGKVVETNAVKLTVKLDGPVITTQPTNQSVTAGAKATFKVAAVGDGLTYQWKVSANNGSTWSTPSADAAKTATYSFTTKAAHNGYLVKCVITDANGKVVESNAVKLTVK